MSQWTSRIENTHIDEYVRKLSAFLDDADARADRSAMASDQLGRLRALSQYISASVSRIDPLLAPLASVASASEFVTAAMNHVTSYVSSGRDSSLQQAADSLETAVANLAQVPLGPVPRKGHDPAAGAKAYLTSVTKITKEVLDDARRVQELLSALESRASAVEKSMEMTKSDITRLTTQQQEQFAAAQERRGADHTQAEAERAKAFATTQEDRKATMDEELAQSTRQRHDIASTLQEYIDDRQRASEELAASIDKEYRRVADGLVAHMEKLKSDADLLVGVIGERGVTSHYQTAARQARKEMWFWQGVVVLTLAGLIAFAVLEFLPAVQNAMNWGAFTARMFVSIGCIALAGFAVAEARLAQKEMTRNREREMHFAALGPYLSTLPSDKQQEFRLRFADVAFGLSAEAGRAISINATPSAAGSASGIDVQKVGMQVIQMIATAIEKTGK